MFKDVIWSANTSLAIFVVILLRGDQEKTISKGSILEK